jgi:hypothetical protein
LNGLNDLNLISVCAIESARRISQYECLTPVPPSESKK